jgi:HK97 family phage prohead protease
MDKNLKFKTFDFELKEAKEIDTEDGPKWAFTGYASTFGNVDLGLDVVDKGAFKRTLKDTKGKIPVLADHDPALQIGWNLKAVEDDTGLLVNGELDLNVQKGKERASLAKTALKIGSKFGLSIGYLTIKAEPDKDQPRIRRLKELRLFEYSFVTFPMNVEAMVTAAKSLGDIDKAKFLLKELESQGIPLKDLEMAFRLKDETADPQVDPAIGQSIDKLTNLIKSL